MYIENQCKQCGIKHKVTKRKVDKTICNKCSDKNREKNIIEFNIKNRIYVNVCKECLNERVYSTKYNYEKSSEICRDCISKKLMIEYHKQNDIYGINNYFYGVKLFQEENPFWGKKHSQETIEKLKITSSKNNKRAMKGKSFYDVWVEKYGKEKADIKMQEHSLKLSNITKGEKNPMFGKPSTKGSGGGWSGWYKGWFFRSLLELSYMIHEIEYNNLVWSCCENINFKIEYLDEIGNKRNYFPDFIVDNKYVIECKPLRLQNTKINVLKKEACERYCEENGLIYKMIDIKNINYDTLISLYLNGDIRFTKKYEERMSKMI